MIFKELTKKHLGCLQVFSLIGYFLVANKDSQRRIYLISQNAVWIGVVELINLCVVWHFCDCSILTLDWSQIFEIRNAEQLYFQESKTYLEKFKWIFYREAIIFYWNFLNAKPFGKFRSLRHSGDVWKAIVAYILARIFGATNSYGHHFMPL